MLRHQQSQRNGMLNIANSK